MRPFLNVILTPASLNLAPSDYNPLQDEGGAQRGRFYSDDDGTALFLTAQEADFFSTIVSS